MNPHPTTRAFRQCARSVRNLRRDAQARKMESMGSLAMGVAHHFNNLLAIILGNSSLREECAADLQDREAFQAISKACLRGRELVRSMFRASWPALAEPQPVDLHRLVREVGALFASSAPGSVAIIPILAAEPVWVLGEGGSLHSALVSLCLNALDAMPQGGVLTLRTTLLEAGRVELSVEDTGAGMGPEVLDRALEPFFTTKQVGAGTGLGLTLVYGVVKAHGGALDITSRKGQGTAVKLRFPRIPPAG